MKRQRLTIVLDKDEYATLTRIATQEERVPSQQATIIVRRVIQEAQEPSAEASA